MQKWKPAVGLAFALSFAVPIAPATVHADEEGKKVGLLFGSYGDADDLSEVRELVTNTITDPDVMPLNGFVRSIVGTFGWYFVKDGLLDEYRAIGGGTGFRARSQRQADLVAQQLQDQGLDAQAYTGFTMTFPYVYDTMDRIREDGIEQLVVFYQGAQYSHVTGYIVFREVNNYLADHPDWDVEVIGVRSFSDDPRFQNLVAENIDDVMETDFAGVPREDICVFLPMHGNVMHWINQGDPSYDQMLRVVDSISDYFPENYVSYGFQNHDEIPFTAWTEPNTDTALDELAQQPCSHVVINGQVSFTVDSLETLYDHSIAEVEYLDEAASAAGLPKEIVVDEMFNEDPLFVEFLQNLALEALAGQGDLEYLRLL